MNTKTQHYLKANLEIKYLSSTSLTVYGSVTEGLSSYLKNIFNLK